MAGAMTWVVRSEDTLQDSDQSLLLTCGFLRIELGLAGKHPSQMSQLAGPMMLFSDSHYGPTHAWVLGVSDRWSARAGRQ